MSRKIYYLWYNMKKRCTNPICPDYKYYGAKGVTISEEWLTFESFKDTITKVDGWDADLFEKGMLQLDKDFSGNNEYSVSSCKFISKDLNRSFQPNKHKLIRGIDADGNKYLFYNQSKFAREHKPLDQGGISDCCLGKLKTHKGWKFEYVQ